MMKPNSLYYGDCLEVMRKWPDSLVDLCYLDPPFNSKTDYNILFDQEGPKGSIDHSQTIAFADTWHWDDTAAERVNAIKQAAANPACDAITGLHTVLGNSGMIAYLSYMAERLIEIKRILKRTGSVYLHCDPTASHYLKIVMDAIFGHQNFRNEIIWRIGWVSGYKSQKRGWIRNHDTILYYIQSDDAAKQFNKEYIPYPEGYVRRDGNPPTGKGIPVEDTWNSSDADVLDSIMIKSFSTEKLGYPTQKPVALLERIIKASSNEDDIVFDPFCGCGTSIVAADNLNRRWVGIDVSPFAIDLIRTKRLPHIAIDVNGVPIDLNTASIMASEKPFEFEKWAVTRIPGLAPNSKQVGDQGIDGRGYLLNHSPNLVLAQVKGGKFVMSQFRDFLHTIQREDAAMGIYITLNKATSRNARVEAAHAGEMKMGAKSYPKVQLWSIEELFDNREPTMPPLADPYTGKRMQPALFN